MTNNKKIFIVGALLAAAVVSIAHSLYVNGYTAQGAENSEATGKPQKNNFNVAAPALASSERPLSVTEVNLRADNTIVFRDEVNALSVSRTQQDLLRKDAKLPKGEPIYLVLDTPGGDVNAGFQLADTAKSLGRKVHTITIFAASMGFYLAENLDTRYILPSGTLMAHRMRVGGVEGQVPGEFLTQAANIVTISQKMEKRNAARLGISFEEYTALVLNEYWVDGEDAVRQGVADKVVAIKCDASLSGEHDEEIMTMFGPIALTWANCPAITAPLGFKILGGGEQERVVDITKALTNYQSFRRKMLR